MKLSFVIAPVVAAVAVAGLLPLTARAQKGSPLAGVWTLNRSVSEFPADIGFNPDWATTAARGEQGAGSSGRSSGGRGSRGSSGGGGSSRGSASPFAARPESYDDARRVQLLTAEVRNPPARLMIVDTPAAVTITNELGQSRTLHPDGKDTSIEIEGVPIGVMATRDGDRLQVVYRLGHDREVRYTYAAESNPARLVVDVQLFERTAGDKARRVYEPGVATETRATPASAGAATPAPSGPAAPAAPPAAGSSPSTRETFDQRPGAELKGLKTLGILVENLSAQATACGLNHDAIEDALSKKLSAGGFAVRRNSDEDTYVYVNIITAMQPNGACVSRYDAFLYTYATAKVSYHDQPVLVQVSLMHRGGIGSTAPTAHAAAVGRGLESYIDSFVTQIHDANK